MEKEQYQDNINFAESQAQSIIDNLSIIKMQELSNYARKSLSSSDIKLQENQQFQPNNSTHFDLKINQLLFAFQNTKVIITDLIFILEMDPQFKKLIQEMHKYKKTLLLRQTQLAMILIILHQKQSPYFIENYTQQFSQLKQFCIPVQKINKKINILILQQLFIKQNQYLNKYQIQIKKIIKDQQYSYKNINKLQKKLQVLNSKFVTIAKIFPYACIINQNDLFAQKKIILDGLNYSVNVYHKKNTEQNSKQFNSLINSRIMYFKYLIKLNVVNASMSILNKVRDLSLFKFQDWGKIAESSHKFWKVISSKGEAHEQAQTMISQANNKLAKQIWNIPDQKMVKRLISVSLPRIQYSQKYFIPRLFRQYLQLHGSIPMPQLLIKDTITYAEELLIRKQYSQRLMLRVNSPFLLRMINQNKNKVQKKNIFINALVNVFNNKKDSVPEKLIYHIHGGGFISMSTFVHQSYTRKWAKSLNIPIISVQYGKAPEQPYPQGLYDCFEGYMWALYCFRQIFEIQPKKIILVGDSAGGNLVAALTTLLISLKIRKPDGIVLVYPALNLNFNNYTPSLLTALNDMILPHTFLKICLDEYLKDPRCKPQEDPLISPILTQDTILKKYPPTRIFVGNADPFHDDCCRLTQRINQLNPGNVKLSIFEEFPHGFLQFDLPTKPHQLSKKATFEVQKSIEQLLNLE